jgi:hypothetical protein
MGSDDASEDSQFCCSRRFRKKNTSPTQSFHYSQKHQHVRPLARATKPLFTEKRKEKLNMKLEAQHVCLQIARSPAHTWPVRALCATYMTACIGCLHLITSNYTSREWLINPNPELDRNVFAYDALKSFSINLQIRQFKFQPKITAWLLERERLPRKNIWKQTNYGCGNSWSCRQLCNGLCTQCAAWGAPCAASCSLSSTKKKPVASDCRSVEGDDSKGCQPWLPAQLLCRAESKKNVSRRVYHGSGILMLS